MLFIAKFLGRLLAALNSEESPKQIAAGFAYGAWIGLLPLVGILPLIFALLAFLININLAVMAAATLVFKLLAYLIDPLANQIGFFLLTKIPSLHPMWTELYNMPIVPYTRFNNTIVLGSLVIGFLLLVPNYFLGKKLLIAYRVRYRDRIAKTKIVQAFKASTIFQWYETYRGIRGG
jgi:uncharacterized protein (TIGR03546 family)